MENPLKRTYTTSLTDDELILFDALFSGGRQFDCLKQGEDFEEIHNFPYSHHLNDLELQETITRFLSQGLMMTWNERFPALGSIRFIGLTEKGGVLWEKERTPDWNLYCEDSSGDENGYWELSVSSPSLETAELFLKTARECGLYTCRIPDELRYNTREGTELIDWKTFPAIHEITVRLAERDEDNCLVPPYEASLPHIDGWNYYEQHRQWWRTINEPLTLAKAGSQG
jgi:hypothetical protein